MTATRPDDLIIADIGHRAGELVAATSRHQWNLTGMGPDRPEESRVICIQLIEALRGLLNRDAAAQHPTRDDAPAEAYAATDPTRRQLRDEVIGYITAYWQQACDGHPYYAFQHDGKTARDMALDYMHERYEDYLNDLGAQNPGILDTFAHQSPELPQADDRTGRAMEAFDRMFDRLWPDPTTTTTGKVLAALKKTISRHDQNYAGYDYMIDPNDLDVMALELANTLH